MYVSPYLRPLPVEDSSRCKFVFSSADGLNKDDNYRGKKRYRFNKWQPISPSMPEMTTDGLVFNPNQEYHLSGIASVFTIPWNASGSVNFLFGPLNQKALNIASGDTFEMGVGFLKYTAPYWGLAQACEFLSTRKLSAGDVMRRHWTLNNIELPFLRRSWNPNNYAGYTLTFSSSVMSILYTEFDSSGNPLFSDTNTHPFTNADRTPFHIVFYSEVSEAANVEVPLIRTLIDVPAATWENTETIHFLENPITYSPPIAPLRDTGLHIYNPPHVALIEDATITVGNPIVSHEWWNTLAFLTKAAPEPCTFTDPDGMEFVVCFQDLTSSSENRTGVKGLGYTLTLAVMVPH